MSEEQVGLLRDLSPEKRALVLKALREGAMETQRAPIGRRDVQDGPIPLSLSQHRLWLADQLRPGSRAYNELSAVRLSGPLDVGVLERVFTEIVRRHEALRTTFPTTDGESVQVIAPARPMKLLVHDLSTLGESEQDAEIQRLADEETGHTFDLSRGPLLRLALLRLSEQQHVLFVSAHHIVLDGWSIGVFRREMTELYRAFRAGQPSPLPELPVQYADFAIWQRQQLREEDRERQLRYWTVQLKDLPPLLQLPTANPRPEIQTFRGARQHFELGAELTEGLKALSQRESVTLFMTLLGAFQILLHRLCNQTDVPVGTVVANRSQAQIEALIGFFVNTLVMRGDLDGNPSVRELLRRVSRVAVEAYEHQELPFEYVVEALQPERSLSYHPLFQAFFDVQNTPRPVVDRAHLTLVPMQVDSAPARFDLNLSMEDTSRGLQGYWQYSTDLFEPDTISRMTGHLQTLLEGMVANPDQHVAMLPLLTSEERRQVLVEWNQTNADVPQGTCIHHLIEAQAARTPDAVAVAHGGRCLTYRALDRNANQLAGRLRVSGVRTGAPVGVCMPRSAEAVVALLGVLKAGGAYVPLDPDWPRERLAEILADADPAALVTQGHLASAVPAGGTPVIFLDAATEECDDGPGDPGVPVSPDDLAYVIYTSGSTGTPKGVLASHRNLVHSTAARWIYYREPVTSFLLVSPFAVDSSVAGIFWTLTQGGSLVVPSDEVLLDIAGLCELIHAQRVSHLLSIPALYAAILEEAQSRQLASLQAVILAGEPCPARIVTEHRRRLGQAAIFNEYGPTEATVWSTVYRCDLLPPRTPVPIGRPIANTQVYLLDDNGQPVPVGVPAELHIGGAGVARGYLNRPELTAEKFVSAGFPEASGTRLYRTGDLARFLPDGNIELLGRSDQQVKIRGFRIELGEIETVLSQFWAAREAVVTVREDEEGNKRVVGYLSSNTAVPFSMDELRGFLSERLPAHAVPSELEVLESLPRLRNGKVDRASLPVPGTPRTGVAAAPGDEWTDLERAIAEIWKATLNKEAVGRDDNFFKIGGDSLSIVRVYNRVRDITETQLAITDLFKHPTVSSLARFIQPEPPAEPGWTELEQAIAEIWKATLNKEAVGRGDNFFKIGGDSLSIVRVYNRVRDITDTQLAITDLFKHPTISSLARFIESVPAEEGSEERRPVTI